MTLPSQRIAELVRGRNPAIHSSLGITDEQIQPASLDCALGDRVYRVTSSFLPRPGETVREILSSKTLYDFALQEGSILEPRTSYIIPLRESLSLPKELSAYSNPKSSIGRSDVFVRLLTDGTPQYDLIPAGYSGALYLEVIPLSFLVRIAPGLSMNQIRFRTQDSTPFPNVELKLAHAKYGLLYRQDGSAVPEGELVVDKGTLFLSVDLLEREVIGFRAKRSSANILDLTKPGTNDPSKFWEPLSREDGEFILTPGDFYILATRERVSVPPEFAAEISSYDPPSGELRSHYAGFFDSGFGYHEGSNGQRGTTAVLEVRAHNVPFRLKHGQLICKMTFEHMMEVPQKLYSPKIGSTYTGNAPQLSKYFRNTWV